MQAAFLYSFVGSDGSTTFTLKIFIKNYNIKYFY